MRAFGVQNRGGLIAAVLAASGAHLATTDEGEQYRDAPFLVAVTRGPEHTFTFVNRMWERVMGLRAPDVIGRRVREVFPHASPTTYAARQRAYRTRRPAAGNAWHYRWTQSDGTRREADFRYIYQPLRNAAGGVEGLLLIATEERD